jgi:hypothetical protein
MEFIVRRPLSKFLAFLSSEPKVTAKFESEYQSQPEELLHLLKSQKQVNDLVHFCQLDANGKLKCQWVQACHL